MPWTHDRSTRDNRMLLAIIIGIVIVAAASALYFQQRLRALDAERQVEDRGANALIQPAFRNDPLVVTLFYPLEGMLLPATAPAKRQSDAQAQAREALAAVFTDPRAMQAAALRELQLKSLYLDERGTAYVDLAAPQQPIRASAWDEQLAVYALVNTLMQNFEEIRQVRFLMDGRTVPTLAGHLDLSRTFTKRLDLVKQ